MSRCSMLLAAGADVNARNHDGDTPLTNAACWGSRKVVELLLAHGADRELADGVGASPAQLARNTGIGGLRV